MQNITQGIQPKTGNLQSPLKPQKSGNTRPTSQGSRTSNGKNKANRGNSGNSKYAQKSRGKSKAPVAVKPKGPVNTYTSVCCSVPATKTPCIAVTKKDALVQGLGKFRCSACKKRCKVTVSKFKAPEVVNVLVPKDAPILSESSWVKISTEVPV
jgi:hypothetical protein